MPGRDDIACFAAFSSRLPNMPINAIIQLCFPNYIALRSLAIFPTAIILMPRDPVQRALRGEALAKHSFYRPELD